MIRRLIGASLLCATTFAAHAQQAASDWPSKTVRVIVPYAPGGSSDTLGRLIAQHLQGAFKQTFVVENRAGAAATIGSQLVAKAPPDGYTLVISGIGSHVIAPVELNVFDPMKDFTHIAMLGGPPTVLVVHPSMPVNNVKELIAHAKGLKAGLSWGSPGVGTHGQLIGGLFSQQVGLTQTHIGYKGAAPAVADLAGGQIPAAFVTLPSAGPFIKSGKIKALGISSAERIPDFKEIPTFNELGYPNLTAATWFSLSGPAGMSPEIVAKINAEVRRGLKTEAVQKQMAAEGMETRDWDADTFTRYVGSEIERWQPLVKTLSKNPS